MLLETAPELLAIHLITREGSFNHIMKDGRILPLEMRKNPDEISGECLLELENWLNVGPGENPASVAAYRELLHEYKEYLKGFPRWNTPPDVELHGNCAEVISGEAEFVFLSFMTPHPWFEGPSGALMFDAVDLVEKGAHVRKARSSLRKHILAWLYMDEHWSVDEAKESLLGLFSWQLENDLKGEKAIHYLRRMKDSKNTGFIQILWKGPLPVNWAFLVSSRKQVFMNTGDQGFKRVK